MTKLRKLTKPSTIMLCFRGNKLREHLLLVHRQIRTKWQKIVRKLLEKIRDYFVKDMYTKGEILYSEAYATLTSAVADLDQEPGSSPVAIGKTDEGGKGRGRSSGLVKSEKLCENCVSPKHSVSDCCSSLTCLVGGCNQNYHTLFHMEKVRVQSLAIPMVEPSN